MDKHIQITKGNPYPIGVTAFPDGSIHIAAMLPEAEKECGFLLYHCKSKTTEKIPFSDHYKVGNLYCLTITGICPEEYAYNYYIDGFVYHDPYARKLYGTEKWGKIPQNIRAGFYMDSFDWENDFMPKIPYENALFYLAHIRGFTKHNSCDVENKGTFEGMIEKIPYLSDLGVTTLEILPAYDFLELVELPVQNDRIPAAYQRQEPILNYWGYKDAFYFAPKRSYCAGKDSSVSFKKLVKSLHQNKMELIMQFYFPKTVKQTYMLEVLRYWVCEYHIDGVHLMGEDLPVLLFATDPILSSVKLIYDDFPVSDIYEPSYTPSYKNLAVSKDAFMYDMRRFLKSDERMAGAVLGHMKYIPDKTGIIHYMTHVNGFTLADLVTYDKKHNEQNLENNRDGNPYNASWNCGEEGRSRKKSVLSLRLKQMKNAFVFNILSLGTPLILAGDEFANSQNGNNNPYCQDNIITWQNWRDVQKNNELYQFVKRLIAFRKEHSVFLGKRECNMSDVLACGYPDLSYHSEEPWKLNIDDMTRYFGIMYCGTYAKNQEGREDTFVYLAVNMHWSKHEFALPKLPEKRQWKGVFNTALQNEDGLPKTLDDQKKVMVEERSIQILIGE